MVALADQEANLEYQKEAEIAQAEAEHARALAQAEGLNRPRADCILCQHRF